jgi:hypothetical protein
MDVSSERQKFSETRRKHEAAGSPFFCLLFFGEAKKSEARGRRNEIDQKIFLNLATQRISIFADTLA